MAFVLGWPYIKYKTIHDGTSNQTRQYKEYISQQTQDISITFIQCWTNVGDV